jgi:hypothetical protein
MRSIRPFALIVLTLLAIAPAALAQQDAPNPFAEPKSEPVGGAIGDGAVAAAKEYKAQLDAGSRPPVRAQAAQEPEPPSGEPQPGGPDEPSDEPDEPLVPGGTGTVDTTGALPRTGLDAFPIAFAGIILLLLGWRLHLFARVREVIRRLRTPKEALREELETLLEAGAERERVYAASSERPVEPATAVARRATSED